MRMPMRFVIAPLLLLVASLAIAPAAKAQAATQHGVTITWAPGDGSPPNLTFNVYRAATTGGPYVQLANTSALTYFDPTGKLGGATEFYVVTAVDSIGAESPFSAELSCNTVPDPKAPKAPSATAR